LDIFIAGIYNRGYLRRSMALSTSAGKSKRNIHESSIHKGL